MIDVDEARTRVLSVLAPLPPRRLSLVDAHGCVLAEDVVAAEPFPPFHTSAMDGYAVRADDLTTASAAHPVRLEVLGDLPAGRVCEHELSPGQAVRIMTGAPVPEGADAVVMVERTRCVDQGVELSARVSPGENIRRRGEDIQAGQVVLARGARIGAGAIGLLAGIGRPEVAAIPKPVVAILSTGDELVEPDQPLEPGKIRNSNSHCIAALVREAGATPLQLGVARDQIADLRAKLERAMEADVIVTSGGVSVGDYDLVKAVLLDMGDVIAWKVRQRPGKPMVFGVLGGKPMFGLPGNPGAVLVSFENFVRPAIGRLSGRGLRERPRVQVVLGEDIKKRAGYRTYAAVTLERRGDQLVALAVGLRSSGALRGMALAHGLVELPEDLERARAGDTAEVVLLQDAQETGWLLAQNDFEPTRSKEDRP